MMVHVWVLLGALNGLVSVLAGAYGRHGAIDPASREMFSIASQYQITHALALMAVAWLASRKGRPRRWPITAAGLAFTSGTVLFAGALYWFGITGLLPVEGMAPVGGWLLIIGWLCLIVAALSDLARGRE